MRGAPRGGISRHVPGHPPELTSNDQIADLLEHRTDIAIRIGALVDSTLHARPLSASPLHVLATPAYLARHGTPATPEALSGHALLGFAQYELGNSWPLRHEAGNSLQIVPALAASSGETLRRWPCTTRASSACPTS